MNIIEELKKYPLSTIIITAAAIIIILLLAFLFYYYSVQSPTLISEESAPAPKIKNTTPVKKPVVPAITPTNIITFSPPDTLPTIQKSGKCFSSSIAQPFRQDAFRCMIGNSIYDPCFAVNEKGFVYCQVGIDNSTGFLIKLTQALPKSSVPETTQNNWAWFVKLKDGALCSPFTGTRPFFGKDQVAYYGCKSNDSTKQIVLLGDLIKDVVWKANEAVLTKTGTAWTINSLQQVDVNTVWQ